MWSMHAAEKTKAGDDGQIVKKSVFVEFVLNKSQQEQRHVSMMLNVPVPLPLV